MNEDAGCLDVTQFLGIVQPSKAPFHSHSYDEVGYVLAGQGFAHVGGATAPLRTGSCFHLPPDEVHCIENSGSGPMRILAVSFLILAALGRLAGPFPYSAGFGDIVTAIFAMALAWRIHQGRTPSPQAIRNWPWAPLPKPAKSI